MRSRRETALAARIADRFLVVTHIRRDDGAASHPELIDHLGFVGKPVTCLQALLDHEPDDRGGHPL